MRCLFDPNGPPVAVPRLWPSSTIVLLGGGLSLTAEDVDHCRGRARVIAINDGHRLAPWADVLYAADEKWWRHYEGVPTFTGLRYSLQRGAGDWGVTVLHNTGPHGLELNPTGLRTGMNSGYQAMNLAVHLGASRVVLLGYDMQRQDGRPSHWFGEHPAAIQSSAPYESFLACFDFIVEPLKRLGVEVVNCSRRTALTCFRRAPLSEVLP